MGRALDVASMSSERRESWDRRYESGSHVPADPPHWLAELADELPTVGCALDVAAGAGPVALWLARAGLAVTAVDISPVGLEICAAAARAESLSVETRVLDLESQPLPDGPWDLIACAHYLQRALFSSMVERVAAGGVLVCEIATVRNLERHARPSERFLLEEGELLELCKPLHIAYYREGWLDGRAQARVLARKHPDGDDGRGV